MSESMPEENGKIFRRQGVELALTQGSLQTRRGVVEAVYGDYQVTLAPRGERDYLATVRHHGRKIGIFQRETSNTIRMLTDAVRFINENDNPTGAVQERRDRMLACPHQSTVDVWCDGYYMDRFGRHVRNVVVAGCFVLVWPTMVGLSPLVLTLLMLNCLAAGMRGTHNMTPRSGFHHELPYFLWNAAALPGSLPYYLMAKAFPSAHRCGETGDFAKDLTFRWSAWRTLRDVCLRW